MHCELINDQLQGSVAMHIWCGDVFACYFIVRFVVDMPWLSLNTGFLFF